MRDPARIDRILGKLRTLWNMHPDQRFGQLCTNYVFYSPRLDFNEECEKVEARIDAALSR